MYRKFPSVLRIGMFSADTTSLIVKGKLLMVSFVSLLFLKMIIDEINDTAVK